MPNSLPPSEREKLIKDSINFFQEYILPKKTVEVGIASKENIQIGIITDAEKIISRLYYKLMDMHFATELSSTNGGNVELYKVLSATEYAVMQARPFNIYQENKHVHDGKHQRLEIDENIINSHFAFNCALIMLSNADGKYHKLFSNPEIMNAIINFKEDGESIGEEHVALLAYETNFSPVQLFANASWWQLFCYAGTLLEVDGTIKGHEFQGN